MIEHRPGFLRDEILGLIKPGIEVAVFDTETTGLKPNENDRIIEFAAMLFDVTENYNMTPKEKIQLYIKPPFVVENKIVELTGITNEFLEDKPTEDDPNEFNGLTPVEEIFEILSGADVCVGHNVGFDVRFVDATMKRHGKPSPFKATADTLKMARDLIPKEQVENHKNGTLVKAMHLDKGIEHFHSAIDDVLGTARLLQKFLWFYRDQPDVEIQFEQLRVESVKRWQKDDLVRLYINTNKGSLYFGQSEDGFYIGSKTIDIDRIDQEKLISDVLEMTETDKNTLMDYGKE